MSIVDSFEMVQIDQRQAVMSPVVQMLQFAGGQTQEMATVEQPGELISGDQVLELAHHPAQGVLVRLQGEAALAHALAHGCT